MRISIITTSFAQAPYITRTIESILNQSGDIEVGYRLVSGGRTDGTLDILHRYVDRFARTSERNRRQRDAINRSLRFATGDIGTRVNSDDTPRALLCTSDESRMHPGSESLLAWSLAVSEAARRRQVL